MYNTVRNADGSLTYQFVDRSGLFYETKNKEKMLQYIKNSRED